MLRRFNTIIITMACIVCCYAVCADDMASRGKELLVASDRRLLPDEGSADMIVDAKDEEGREQTYEVQCYVSAKGGMTVVFVAPKINKNDVALRSKDKIYFKHAKWPKPEIKSYQSAFVESDFSFGDVVSSDFALDYEVLKIEDDKVDDIECHKLTLSPVKEGRYAKVEIWINKSNMYTLKRLYYTASGEKLKIAVLTDFVEKKGMLVSYTINMENFILESKSSAEVFNIKKEKLPKMLFDPNNIGRIHAR